MLNDALKWRKWIREIASAQEVNRLHRAQDLPAVIGHVRQVVAAPDLEYGVVEQCYVGVAGRPFVGCQAGPVEEACSCCTWQDVVVVDDVVIMEA